MKRDQLTGDKTREQVRRERRLAELKADPGDKRHGTMTGYRYGCRCSRCKTARFNSEQPRWKKVTA